MPVPRREPGTSARPSGVVDPAVDLTGLTELRVHGVGGATPSVLLDDLAPLQVAGDATAGFFRTSDVSPGGRRRHVEAYSWGGLTSRSASRVLWLLLLPFLVANLSGWTVPQGGATHRWRWALRLASLGLTVSAVLLVCLTTLDVLGYQCLGDPSCTSGTWWLGWAQAPGLDLAARPGRRLALLALVPVLLLAGLALLSRRTRRRYEDVRPPWRGAADAPPPRVLAEAAALRDGWRDPRFWDGGLAHRRSTDLHVAAAAATLLLVVVHTARTTSGAAEATASTVAGRALLVLGAAVLVGVLLLLPVERGTTRPARVLALLAGAGLLAALVLALVQPAVPTGAGHLPGVRVAVNAGYAGVLLALVPLLLLTVAAEVRAWRARSGVPRFRWGAPFVLQGLAALLLSTALLSVLVAVAQLVGDVDWCTDGCSTPPGQPRRIAVFTVVQAAVTWLTVAPAVAAVAFLAVEALRWWRAGSCGAAAVVQDYRGLDAAQPPPPAPPRWAVSALDEPAHARAWPRGVARWRWLAGAATDVSLALTALVATAVVVVGVAQVLVWLAGGSLPGATTIGLAIAAAFPVGLLALLRSGWRSLDRRRGIGILWDVGTFWPRGYHPFAPPSYAERAVPELLRRLWRLHDEGARVVVVAHSQGTVLAAAALAQDGVVSATDEGPRREVSLVTFGSPLRTLYSWAFPAYVPPDVLGRIADGAGPLGPREWLNVRYPTDLIGGPVLDPRDPRAAQVDLELPDPPTSWHVYGDPPPRVGGHSGYWHDERMWRRIDGVAERLDAS